MMTARCDPGVSRSAGLSLRSFQECYLLSVQGPLTCPSRWAASREKVRLLHRGHRKRHVTDQDRGYATRRDMTYSWNEA